MQINSDNSLLKQVLKRVSTPFLVLTGNTHGIKPYQKWTHLPTTSVPGMDPSSCPNLRLPFCLQRRLHFFVGAKSEESQLDMSVYGWWQSLLLSELDKQTYLETGEKNRWTVLKKMVLILHTQNALVCSPNSFRDSWCCVSSLIFMFFITVAASQKPQTKGTFSGCVANVISDLGSSQSVSD